MASDTSPKPDTDAVPPFSMTSSRGCAQWLHGTGGSLAFSTYQANKLFLIGTQAGGTRLSVFERSFPRCMGLGIGQDTIWLSSIHTLWQLKDFLDPGQVHQDHDALYVPLKGHTTGDIDIHDVHVRADGTPLFVATKFNCLATLAEDASFQPVWMPPWIDRVAAEDRCHLNGMAVVDDQPAYVSAVGASNVVGGWREHKRTGGMVLDVATGKPVATGLSMPHSPRVYRDRLWVIQSGTGEFGWIDRASGRFEPLCFLQGFARGLCFHENYAIIGVSKPRAERTFSGLALNDRLDREGVSAKCYIAVIDLKTGDQVHAIEMEGPVQELYDVQFIPGKRRPMALGFKTNDICFTVRPGAFHKPGTAR